MTDSLGTLLTQLLQDRGVLPDDYRTLSTAVFDSLGSIDKQVRTGEYIQFPNGQPYFKR